MQYDVIVIGSGISGLCSALVLAQHGLKTAVFEQARHMSPLLSRFRRGQSWFDCGYHYHGNFHRGSALEMFMRSMGLDALVDESIPMNSKAYDQLVCSNGSRIVLPTGMEAVRDSLKSQFPKDSKAIDAYLERIQKVLDSSPFTNKDLPPEDATFSIIQDIDLQSFFDQIGASAEFAEAISNYGYFLYGVPWDETPFYLHAQVVGSFYQSALSFRQGGDTVVQAFRKRFEEEGVDVFTESMVTKIVSTERRRLKGVMVRDASGEEYFAKCRRCISTIHPRELAAVLDPGVLRPFNMNRLCGFDETFSPFAIYLEVKDPPGELYRSNVYHLAVNGHKLDKENSLAILNYSEKPENGKTGICILGQAWETTKGHDCHGIEEGFCRLSNEKNGQPYEEYKEAMQQYYFEKACQVLPELKQKARIVDAATPCSFERYTRNWMGSIYGIRHTTDRAGLSPFSMVKGLYLAGQNIVAPGLMGAAISAFVACGCILGWNQYWNKVHEYR
ncbi:MAG: phytoene desaturase family protein [Candidatus Sumerlaeia bacterium]